MRQKIIWMRYLQLTNRLVMLLVFATVFGCGHHYEWKYTITVRFINETDHIIYVKGVGVGCEIPDIPAHSTRNFVYELYYPGTSKHDKPNVDNFDTEFQCGFFYGDTGKCEGGVAEAKGVDDFSNREDREQTGEFSFKFTYRFTEERFQNAQECR